MTGRLMIRLSFHRDDSRLYPTGYWVAEADADGSIQFDGDGLTPLDAMMALAKQMHECIDRHEERT